MHRRPQGGTVAGAIDADEESGKSDSGEGGHENSGIVSAEPSGREISQMPMPASRKPAMENAPGRPCVTMANAAGMAAPRTAATGAVMPISPLARAR